MNGELELELELWNGAVCARPAAVRRCHDAAEVSEAVRWARAEGMPLSVLGGGHDWAGRAVRAGGLVIDLRGMRDVEVHGEVATVAGGATAGDLIAAAAISGQSAATGTVGAVGMAGLTLGGGYGVLTGVAGLAADNLVSAEVVLADGTVVTAGESSEPDLLWALRGGGGNFGVVTSMRVRLHPIPLIHSARVLFPLVQALDVLVGFGELVADAPDELTARAGVLSAPDGTAVVFAAPTWSGDAEEGAYRIKQFDNLGTPTSSVAAVTPYSEQLRRGDAMFARDGRHYAIRTRNLAALTPAAADTLVAAGTARTSPLSAISLHHVHGAAARVPLSSTAFGIRQEHFMTEIISSWLPTDVQPSDRGATHRQWADTAADVLGPHALPGGYPNLLAADHLEQTAHAYGPNAARLTALKDSYDPDGVFTAIPLPPRHRAARAASTT